MTHYKSGDFVFLKLTGQIGIVVEARDSGVRVKHIGIVPYDECRRPTEDEVNNWLKSKEKG